MLQSLTPSPSAFHPAKRGVELETAGFARDLRDSISRYQPKPILTPDGRVLLALTVPGTTDSAPTLPRDGAIIRPLPAGTRAAQDFSSQRTIDDLARMSHHYGLKYLHRKWWVMAREIGYSEAVPFQQPRDDGQGITAIGGWLQEQLGYSEGGGTGVAYHKVATVSLPSSTSTVVLIVRRSTLTTGFNTASYRKILDIRLAAGSPFNNPDPALFISPLWSRAEDGTWLPHPLVLPSPGLTHRPGNVSGTLL